MPDEQQVAPVQPVPPHWPYSAEHDELAVDVVAGAVDVDVVVAVDDDEDALPSLLSTKARAACPYSDP